MNFKIDAELTNDLIVPKTDLDTIKTLSEYKSLLDNYSKEWNIAKKKIHDYEYVYTSPYANKNICNKIPISRSYFKMVEITYEFDLLSRSELDIFCMAEAPGGFIQSFLEYSEKIKRIGAVTLLSDNKSIPYWNRNIKQNNLIEFYEGVNKDGDLCNFINILSIIKNVGKSSIDILTGDGGFDNSDDYNNQESNSLSLIYGEIFMALNLQKERGSFICKFFDIFLKETVKLIYLLFLSYDEILIYKPCLSRFSNSEKYIICKGFKGYNQEFVNKLCRSFHNKDLDIIVNCEFNKKIKEFNCEYTKRQINQIKRGITMIETRNLSPNPTQKQIDIAIKWCNKYNIPINNKCFYLNCTGSEQRFNWRS